MQAHQSVDSSITSGLYVSTHSAVKLVPSYNICPIASTREFAKGQQQSYFLQFRLFSIVC